MRQRDPLGYLAADDQPADQPRPGAGRHASQRVESHPGLRHHPAHQAGQKGQQREQGEFADQDGGDFAPGETEDA